MSFASSSGAIRYTLQIDDSQVTQKLNSFKTSLKGLDSTTSSSTRNFGQMNNAISQTQTGTSKLMQGLNALKSNFGQLTTGVGVAMSTIVNLNRTWQDLGDTQIRVDQTQLKISRTQEALTKAQAKYNTVSKDVLSTTEELQQARTDLTQAEEAAALAVTNHGEALEDQQRAHEDFYLNIISAGISNVGVLTAAMQTLGVKGASVTKIITGMIPAVTGLGNAMKALTVGGIVGLAITGVALLVTEVMRLQEEKKKLDESLKNTENIGFGTIHNPFRTQEDIIRDAQILHNEFLRLKSDTSNPGLFHANKYKIRNDLDIFADLYPQAAAKTNVLTAAFKTQNQVLVTGLLPSYEQTIDYLIRLAQSGPAADEALRLVGNFVEFADAKMTQWNPTIEENKQKALEAQAAWEAYLGTVKSFSDQILGMDKKGFKDFFENIGFGKNTRKDLWKQNLKALEIDDIFEDLRNAVMSFDRFTFDDDVLSNWVTKLKDRITKAIEKNPNAKSILQPLLELDKGSTPEQIKNTLVSVLNKIKGDPELQKIASLYGIDFSTDFAGGLGQGFAKMDLSKFIKVNESGGTTATGNPLTPLINIMTKSIDQTIDYLTKSFAAIKLSVPPVDMSTYAGNLNDAVSAAKSTAKNVTKNLKVEWPPIDMDTYAGNLNDSVTAAKDTRKKIEKALSSEIKIKVSFDVDKPPKITESGGKIDVKFAAAGYQGWVRNPQMFMVGEGGEDEYVSITPKSKLNSGSSLGGPSGPVNLNVTFQLQEGEFFNALKLQKVVRDITGRNTSRHL